MDFIGTHLDFKLLNSQIYKGIMVQHNIYLRELANYLDIDSLWAKFVVTAVNFKLFDLRFVVWLDMDGQGIIKEAGLDTMVSREVLTSISVFVWYILILALDEGVFDLTVFLYNILNIIHGFLNHWN